MVFETLQMSQLDDDTMRLAEIGIESGSEVVVLPEADASELVPPFGIYWSCCWSWRNWTGTGN